MRVRGVNNRGVSNCSIGNVSGEDIDLRKSHETVANRKCFSPNTDACLLFEPLHHFGCVGNHPIFFISPSSSECHHWLGERAAASIRVTCGWVPTPWDAKSTVRVTPAIHGVGSGEEAIAEIYHRERSTQDRVGVLNMSDVAPWMWLDWVFMSLEASLEDD